MVDEFVTSVEYRFSVADNRSGEMTFLSKKDKQRFPAASRP